MSGRERSHVAPALGAGLAFVLAGSALLIQELDRLALSWAVVVPAILIVVGAATAIAGMVGIAGQRGDRS